MFKVVYYGLHDILLWEEKWAVGTIKAGKFILKEELMMNFYSMLRELEKLLVY